MRLHVFLPTLIIILVVILGYKGLFDLLKPFQAQPSINSTAVRPYDGKTSTQCLRRYFSTIALVIIYNHPHYDSVSLLRQFYEPVFPNIYVCGSKSNESFPNITYVDINRGIFGYECLSHIIRRYYGYDGYFYINDDVILNYWNLVHSKFDRDHIWESNNQFGTVSLENEIPENWYWWVSPYGFQNCRKAVDKVKQWSEKFKVYHNLYNTYMQNGNETKYARNGRSDILYLPRHHALHFQELSRIFFQENVFLEIALPTILRFLAPSHDIRTLKGHYIPGDVRKNDPRVVDSRYFWVKYLQNPNFWFIHPFKLQHRKNKNRELNIELLKHILIGKTKSLTKCSI